MALYVHAVRPGEGCRPAMVFFFGGGWTGGTVEQFLPQAEHFASRGIVTVRADYRVKGRHGTTPTDAVHDARAALRWVRAHAGQLGVDPRRVIGAGGSAGGHLACCAAMQARQDHPEDRSLPCRPNVLVLYNPVLDFAQTKFAELCPSPQAARAITPTLQVTGDLPPTLLLYGSADPFLPGGRTYERLAAEAGNRIEFYLAEGEKHGFFNHSPWLERTTARVEQFLASLGCLSGA